MLKIPCALMLFCCVFASCNEYLEVSRVVYQSVRAQKNVPSEIPEDAKIVVVYNITENGAIIPVVFNRTDEIMIIDQTKSFFVNSDGISKSYYDPTIRTTSTTAMSSTTGGASVNLGAIGGLFGIGGPVGSLLNGINVGGAETAGSATTNTTYFADQPQVALAPRSSSAMSKSYMITGLGQQDAMRSFIASKPKESYCKFSVCISYSIDEGKTFDKVVTDFYVNAQIVAYPPQKGMLNDALRSVYHAKSDALSEQWWVLRFVNNIPESESAQKIHDTRFNNGCFYDYK